MAQVNGKGKWHILTIDGEDENAVTVIHPSACRWSIDFTPRQLDSNGHLLHESMWVQRYECDIAWHIDNAGTDHWSGLPQSSGHYWLQLEHVVSPSGPWGPAEHDSEITFHEIRDTLFVERMEPLS